MKQRILIIFLLIISLSGFAQDSLTIKKKERLDFAKGYFEAGGTFFPSFKGKRLIENSVVSFENPVSAIQYLNWGAFHFWGHAEFYVTFPMNYFPFEKNEEASSEILHSVATGARFLPWAYKEKKIRPYVGVNWSAMDFKQKIKPDDNQPVLSKDFMLAYDAGLMFGYRSFAMRLGVYYFRDTKWDYPLSKTVKAEVVTPNFGLQLGLLYSMDFSRNKDQALNDRWNSYPRLSRQSLGSTRTGDFFVAVGPSLSFSLKESEYNKSALPYLKDQLTSSSYFDIAAGYHFQKLGLFSDLTFRNPKFETEGFGSKQSIRKTSLLLEANKYLLDYSGFTPFIGVNIAYENIRYSENIDGEKRKLNFGNRIEPGITVGWDIQPGKNQEAIILRTNLRWYPLSDFKIDGKQFEFSQLEYNLIQVVLYPQRLKKKGVV